MKHQTGGTGWPSGNVFDFHGGADCWSYGIRIPVGKRNLFVYIYRIDAFYCYFYFLTCLIFVSPHSGRGPQKLATHPIISKKLFHLDVLGPGVDHSTTKPVQNAFYTKINFIFSKYLGGRPPGPHGHDATGPLAALLSEQRAPNARGSRR